MKKRGDTDGCDSELETVGLDWCVENIPLMVAEDPERFTSVDALLAADAEEDCLPPEDWDSRTRAVNGVTKALVFSQLLFRGLSKEGNESK